MGAQETVTLRGPLFEGQAPEIVEQMAADATWAVGQAALADWHELLDEDLVNPTPYYETQLTIQAFPPSDTLVHDRDIIYGPWLEGTGSRNATTRFPGYGDLRQAAQDTEEQVDEIVADVVDRAVARLNGGG